MDADEEIDAAPWLAVKGLSFYYPTLTEDCVCGYAGSDTRQAA